jgi:hypothetical protein
MQQAPQGFAPPPTKKSGNGCLIALAVVGGLVLLVVAVAAFGIYRAASSPEGKKLIGAIGGAAKLMAEAQNAPGAAEVRALGCSQAMVIDTEKMGEMFGLLDASAPAPGEAAVMVVCQVQGGTPPTCDAVAKTYATAGAAPHRGFEVSITHNRGTSENVCQTIYDATGRKLRDVPAGSGRHVNIGK